MASNVFTGARARFSVGGVPIGYATNCSGSEEVVYEAIDVLDSIETKEFAPVGYRVTFSASRVRLIGSPSGTNGSLRKITSANSSVFPLLGKDATDLLQNVLAVDDDLACTIEDRFSGDVFMTLQRVKIASHNWSVTARGVVGEDITFVAIRMKDESEQVGGTA